MLESVVAPVQVSEEKAVPARLKNEETDLNKQVEYTAVCCRCEASYVLDVDMSAIGDFYCADLGNECQKILNSRAKSKPKSKSRAKSKPKTKSSASSSSSNSPPSAFFSDFP